MNARVLTVSQLNEYVKMLLDGDEVLADVFVRGEISNFTNHYKTGHFYFSLKDEGAVIRSVMFRSSAMRIRFTPENGMKVIARGRISAFVRDGQYQLYCESMEPDGIGALYLAFEQLKKKLSEEGLFDASHKKPLPKYPRRIGIITSPTGAAVRDIINILKRRFPLAQALLYPVLVQGEEAAPQLIRALNYFNSENNADVLIIGRGGGSIEDLWAFNSEALARAVYTSRIPVISAVGHETDFTICDFAADVRAPTPSAAAEIAVPDESELRRYLAAVKDTLRLLTDAKLKKNREALNNLALSHVLKKPGAVIDERRMDLLFLGEKLSRHAQSFTAEKRARLSEAAAKLNALSPLAVLGRGYTLATDKYGSLIVRAAQLNKGDEIEIVFDDGAAGAVVKDIKMR